jgi:cysteine-rich repeat protein
MRRVGLIAGGLLLAAAFGGTVVYAAVTIDSPDPSGVVHACYDKGGRGAGKVRIVNNSATDCKPSEEPLTWRALNTFEQLSGTPCEFNDEAGTIAVSYDPSGFASFRCVVPGFCATANECPVPSNECEERTCQANTCGSQLKAYGAPCSTGICDGDGTCIPTDCGDGLISGDEQCDDGDAAPNDGCDSSCQIEAAENGTWECTGQPSSCSLSCDAGFGDCDDGGGSCETDLLADDNHCGGCNNPCSVGEVCSSGQCVPD